MDTCMDAITSNSTGTIPVVRGTYQYRTSTAQAKTDPLTCSFSHWQVSLAHLNWMHRGTIVTIVAQSWIMASSLSPWKSCQPLITEIQKAARDRQPLTFSSLSLFQSFHSSFPVMNTSSHATLIFSVLVVVCEPNWKTEILIRMITSSASRDGSIRIWLCVVSASYNSLAQYWMHGLFQMFFPKRSLPNKTRVLLDLSSNYYVWRRTLLHLLILVMNIIHSTANKLLLATKEENQTTSNWINK